MQFKKITVTATNFDIKKSVTITVDMSVFVKYKTLEDVKKSLEERILSCKVLHKENMPNVKYQGLNEVIDEWKLIRPEYEKLLAEQSAETIEGENPDTPFDLNRFLSAQEYNYPVALEEMRNGRKRGHWIWYIFPQEKGLGHSYNSMYYGLDGLEEAKAYLRHPVLSFRLREICQAVLDNSSLGIRHIMGSNIDVIKLRSSMQIFDLASPNDIFAKVLETFF